MTDVKDFLTARLQARSTMAKALIAEDNPEAKLLATDAADIALLGTAQLGERQVACYQRMILSQMGLSDEAMAKADEIVFMTPALLPLDDAALAVWHWQADTFDGRATPAGVINHLRAELTELEEVLPDYLEDMESIKDRQLVSGEVADILVLALHLCALTNMEPSAVLANKLNELRTRDYSGSPDSDGKITHDKEPS